MKIEVEIEAVSDLMRKQLLDDLSMHKAGGDFEDPALERALHTVIAYYSVPGTYMEGAYDGEDA